MASNNLPLVSVCIQTYNHEKYIGQCLDSILMQKTNFPFEIILGEDKSSDNTREICKRYAEEYPDKIRLFLRKREDVIYVNGNPTGRFNFLENIKASKGKYIAICEGDDYWTDENKLQKQVDFLEANSDYSICSHFISTDLEGVVKKRKYNFVRDEGKYLLIHNFIPLLTILYRRSAIPDEMPDFYLKCIMGDLPMHYYVAKKGKIKVIKEYMGVRRIHKGGTWSQVRKTKQLDNYIASLKHLSAGVPKEHIKFLNTGINKLTLKKAITLKFEGKEYKEEFKNLKLGESLNSFVYGWAKRIILFTKNRTALLLVDKILNKV